MQQMTHATTATFEGEAIDMKGMRTCRDFYFAPHALFCPLEPAVTLSQLALTVALMDRVPVATIKKDAPRGEQYQVNGEGLGGIREALGRCTVNTDV